MILCVESRQEGSNQEEAIQCWQGSLLTEGLYRSRERCACHHDQRSRNRETTTVPVSKTTGNTWTSWRTFWQRSPG